MTREEHDAIVAAEPKQATYLTIGYDFLEGASSETLKMYEALYIKANVNGRSLSGQPLWQFSGPDISKRGWTNLIACTVHNEDNLQVTLECMGLTLESDVDFMVYLEGVDGDDIVFDQWKFNLTAGVRYFGPIKGWHLSRLARKGKPNHPYFEYVRRIQARCAPR